MTPPAAEDFAVGRRKTMVMCKLALPKTISKFHFWLFLSWLNAGTESFGQYAFSRIGPNELAYVFEPVLNEDSSRFSVHVYFQGDSSGTTRLILPSEWGGQAELYHGIQHLSASPAPIQDTPNANIKQITHEPNAVLHIHYQIRQDWVGDLIGKTYRPILTQEYFHFIGYAIFVCPDWDEEKPLFIKLRWKNLPLSWKLANSFAAGDTLQALSISLSQLRHAVYVGGDFRVKHVSLGANSLYTAMRGKWHFVDEEFFDLVEKIVATQRAFWRDQDFPYYLVTLIPTGMECCSYGGTGLTNSFATFVATDRSINLEMKRLLAHELLHTWIGQKIPPADSPGSPEALCYWFSEGFTDYYARELLWRAKLITCEEYVSNWNQKIYEYHVSPARNATNARVAQDFWKDRNMMQLPYRRGELLAQRWNTEIKAVSQGRYSLDEVMLGLLLATKTASAVFSDTLLNRMVEPYLQRGIFEDLRRYVDHGETIAPAANALGFEAVLEDATMTPFDLGFDFAASEAQGILTGVRENGPAFRAGLRNGQRLKGFSISWNQPQKEVELRVEDDQGHRTIRYLPAGEKIKIPQYRWR